MSCFAQSYMPNLYQFLYKKNKYLYKRKTPRANPEKPVYVELG
jgi:hypothetical protein